MAKEILTAQRLRELLNYDPETGVFTRLVTVGGRLDQRSGSIAGNINRRGYARIGVDGKRFFSHRLAFLWVTGEWPIAEVDHVDGTTSNNAWTNLRDVSRTVNLQNQRRPRIDNESGLLGVHTLKNGKHRAVIKANGMQIYIGQFDKCEEAHAAYIDAKRRMHEGCTL
jgi:hypothetical protein